MSDNNAADVLRDEELAATHDDPIQVAIEERPEGRPYLLPRDREVVQRREADGGRAACHQADLG